MHQGPSGFLVASPVRLARCGPTAAATGFKFSDDLLFVEAHRPWPFWRVLVLRAPVVRQRFLPGARPDGTNSHLNGGKRAFQLLWISEVRVCPISTDVGGSGTWTSGLPRLQA